MVLKTLCRVRFHSFRTLVRISVQHITFLYPTYLATKKCMAVSTHHFGRNHYNNGQANAFRHALWNYLIAKKCTKWSKDLNKVVQWTKAITDWHEIAFINRPLAKAMDLHNNNIGRKAFIAFPSKPGQEIVVHLLELAAKSIKINSDSNLALYPLHLVHLTDDE